MKKIVRNVSKRKFITDHHQFARKNYLLEKITGLKSTRMKM